MDASRFCSRRSIGSKKACPLLYCQQCRSANVVIRYANINEGTGELDAEQALAGSQCSREDVVFQRDRVTGRKSSAVYRTRVHPIHASIGEASRMASA